MLEQETSRLSEPPWVLAKRAMGSPRAMRTKLKKLFVAVLLYGRDDRVIPRLKRLKRLGRIDVIPTRTQRMVGAIDMLRFFIVPAAADYYDQKGISFRFHTLLRWLDDPASVIDPTGFNSTRDAIIGHVMQVVHANPLYDFELLDSFEDGIAEMERQIEAVIAGTHPRTESIRAIVEDPHYHERLLQFIRDYRKDPDAPPLLRENILTNEQFRDAERTFGSLHNAIRYFAKMPRTVRGGLRHLTRVKEFPARLAS